MNEIAKSDNAKTRESLYKAILASTFILEETVSGGTDAGGKTIADENTRVAFKTIEHPAGNVILPVFSDVDALASFAGANARWVALGAQALFQSIAPGDVAEVRVNPFRVGQAMKRPGGIITRNEFMALAQGLLPEQMISNNTMPLKVAGGQKLFIGRPAKEPPAELLSKLADYFQQIPELRGAYLFQMAQQTQQNVTSTVVGIHFGEEPNAQRMEEIMRGVGDDHEGDFQRGCS
jgi:hypothetical protein